MKVILYMAPSVNGYVARPDDTTDFVSDVEWESFLSMLSEVGNLITGRRTYELMVEDGTINEVKAPIVVVTTKTLKPAGKNHFVAHSPREALDILKKQGFNTALIGSGGTLNSSFMKEGLIDEIYLDVEPVVLGKGIKLFADADFEAKLELLETKMISPNEIQLHYKVVK